MVYIPAGAIARLPQFWRRWIDGLFALAVGWITGTAALAADSVGLWLLVALFAGTFVLFLGLWFSERPAGVGAWRAYAGTVVLQVALAVAVVSFLASSPGDPVPLATWAGLAVAVVTLVLRTVHGARVRSRMRAAGTWHAYRTQPGL